MAHQHLADPTGSVIHGGLPATDGDRHSPHTVEIDCPPGLPRPGDLIGHVLEGTGLEPDSWSATPFFGHATWTFSKVTCEEWAKAQPTTSKRLKALYHAGTVRYATW